MWLPVGPLALLIAVETLPDLMRTLGNVSMDVAATTVAARRAGFEDAPRTDEDALLERGA
jgi:Na+/H+-dicarboxylate symporter